VSLVHAVIGRGRIWRISTRSQALLDYLEGGENIQEFLDDFPSVSREHLIAFIEEAGRALLSRVNLHLANQNAIETSTWSKPCIQSAARA